MVLLPRFSNALTQLTAFRQNQQIVTSLELFKGHVCNKQITATYVQLLQMSVHGSTDDYARVPSMDFVNLQIIIYTCPVQIL